MIETKKQKKHETLDPDCGSEAGALGPEPWDDFTKCYNVIHMYTLTTFTFVPIQVAMVTTQIRKSMINTLIKLCKTRNSNRVYLLRVCQHIHMYDV